MAHKPSVQFVCVHNAGRSQMAAGYLTHLAGNKIDVRSAGSEPADQATRSPSQRWPKRASTSPPNSPESLPPKPSQPPMS